VWRLVLTNEIAACGGGKVIKKGGFLKGKKEKERVVSKKRELLTVNTFLFDLEDRSRCEKKRVRRRDHEP